MEKEFIIEDGKLVNFKNINNLEKVVVPEGVTMICEWVFGGKNGVKEVILPDTVTNIDGYAFALSEIERIVIPEGVTQILMATFCECYNLKEAVLPESLVHIGHCAFKKSGIRKITIPKNVKEILVDAFYDCQDLEQVIFNEGVEFVDGDAFQHCIKLKEVHLPASLKKLDPYTFAGCKDIKVTAPKGSAAEAGIKDLQYYITMELDREEDADAFGIDGSFEPEYPDYTIVKIKE